VLAKLDHKRSLLTVSSLCILKPVVQVIIHLNYGLVERDLKKKVFNVVNSERKDGKRGVG